MALAPIVILAGALVATAQPIPAGGAIYLCSFAKVLSNGQGKVYTREVSETVRVGPGILQAWSDEDAVWLPNQCADATCEATANGFRFEMVVTTPTSAYTSVVSARLTIAATTGAFDAETRFATTLAGSGYQTEANTRNTGICHPTPDPAAH